jgi:hypothetical protein
MKTLAREVVNIHYKDELYPTLDFDLNSSQYEKLIAGNVNRLIRESTFHVGLTRDDNVGVPSC